MRRLVFLVYALVFTTELNQAAIVPLLPLLGRELTLSGVETGAVLAAATFVTVLVAMPIGMLADRIGARRLTAVAGLLIVAAALMQGLATSAPLLLAGRAVFGLAFAIVWTAGIKLVSGATTNRRSSAIGGTIAVGGLAHLVGPTAAGFLAERVSVVTPFAIIAGLAAVATAILSVTPGLGKPVEERRRLRDAVHAVRRHAELRSALVVMALLGVVAGIVPLLVPLALDENGLSASQIGLVFSLSACVWVAASAIVAKMGARAVHVSAAALGVVALGTVFLLPVLTLATAGIAAFLLLRAATHAPLSTICYPLAESASRGTRMGEGAAVGLANLVWAACAAVTPIVAGAMTGTIGVRATFAIVAITFLLAGAWMLASRRTAGGALVPRPQES